MASANETLVGFTMNYKRFSAKWFSGGLKEIIGKLPDTELRTYSFAGYGNFFFSLAAGVSAYYLSSIFFTTNVVASFFIAYAFFAGCFILFKYVIGRLINTGGPASSGLYYITGILIALFVTFGCVFNSANNNRIENDKKKLLVYDSLTTIKKNIDSARSDLHNWCYENITMGNPSLAFSAKDNNYKSYLNNILSQYDDFLKLAKSGSKLILPINDTIRLSYLIKEIEKANKYDSLNIYKNNLQDINPSVTHKTSLPDFLNLLRINYSRMFSIFDHMRDSVEDITNYFNGSLSPQISLNILLVYFNFNTYANLSILFTLIIILLFVHNDIKRNENDLYHRLLSEKKRLEEEFLIQQRTKIVEDYTITTELKHIRSFEETSVAPAKRAAPTISSAEPTDVLTPNGLLEAATISNRRRNYTKALEYLNKAIELETDLKQKDPIYQLIPEIYELKAVTLRNLNLIVDADIADKTALAIRNEASFLSNKNKAIKLDKLLLQDVSIFDNFTWNFKPGINILLGKNGYGKSHLLGLVITLLYDDKVKIKDWIQGTKATANTSLYLSGDIPGKELEDELKDSTKKITELQNKLDENITQYIAKIGKALSNDELENIFATDIQAIDDTNKKIIDLQVKIKEFAPTISADTNTIKTLTGKIPILAIPDSRFIDKSGDSLLASASEFSDIAKYGAYEFLYSLPYAKVIENVLFKSCIYYFESGKNFKSEPFELIQRVIKDLSSDKLVSKEGVMVYQDESKFEFISITSNDKNASFTINVQPEDAVITLPIQKVSQGTFSVISICCLIFNYLSAIQTAEKIDPLKKQAIVMIDELDAHIHPSWQRKLIPILRKNFPNVQFIISAHSPLLIEGCKANEVSVLRRTSEGKFKIDTINKSMVGLSIENIYSLIFEIENRDFAMLRYKELAPYLDSFKKELEELKIKGETKELLDDEINRKTELQDLIMQIDVSADTFNRTQQEKQKETQGIAELLEAAAIKLQQENIQKIKNSINSINTTDKK